MHSGRSFNRQRTVGGFQNDLLLPHLRIDGLLSTFVKQQILPTLAFVVDPPGNTTDCDYQILRRGLPLTPAKLNEN